MKTLREKLFGKKAKLVGPVKRLDSLPPNKLRMQSYGGLNADLIATQEHIAKNLASRPELKKYYNA